MRTPRLNKNIEQIKVTNSYVTFKFKNPTRFHGKFYTCPITNPIAHYLINLQTYLVVDVKWEAASGLIIGQTIFTPKQSIGVLSVSREDLTELGFDVSELDHATFLRIVEDYAGDIEWSSESVGLELAAKRYGVPRLEGYDEIEEEW